MDRRLAAHNSRVRRWADKQPLKYRKTALAFGYRCNTKTLSFDQTLDWVSAQSRKRRGEGVSVSTLKRHLKVFEANGLVTVTRRKNKDRTGNMSSVYTVDLTAEIKEDTDLALAAWLRDNPVTKVDNGRDPWELTPTF